MYIDLVTINLCPGQGGGGVKPSGTLTIVENGVYNVYSYSSASVDVHPSISLSETYISNGSYNITGEFNGGVITVDVPQSVIGITQKEITEGDINIINLDNSASFVASNIFSNNQNIQTVNLPYATTVGKAAFFRCYSLSQVNLPVCSFIDNNAFYGCSSLSQVNLPVCSYIGNSVFFNCFSLSQVSIPLCEYIGSGVFRTCSLLSLSLPVCSYIGGLAFYGCSSLSIITIGYSGICSLGDARTFETTQITSSTGSIYVPTSLVDSYKSANYWSYFSTQIFPIE